MPRALKDWSEFCLELALDDKRHTYSIRKIVPDVMFSTDLDQTIRLEDLGYSKGGTKISMLKKYYYNQESINEAKAALEIIQKKGGYGSVAFSTIGQKKKFTHHQHCIQSIAIRHLPKGELQYTVFYRACEVVKIFTGDMVFLRDIIMPIFGKGPVTFVFSNATLNSMYIPLLMILDRKMWVKNLDKIRAVDPDYHKRILTWCKRYFADDAINYKSAERVQSHIKKYLSKSERDEILDKLR